MYATELHGPAPQTLLLLLLLLLLLSLLFRLLFAFCSLPKAEAIAREWAARFDMVTWLKCLGVGGIPSKWRQRGGLAPCSSVFRLLISIISRRAARSLITTAISRCTYTINNYGHTHTYILGTQTRKKSMVSGKTRGFWQKPEVFQISKIH